LAFDNAERLFAKVKAGFDGFCKRRIEMLERARTVRNKEITVSFQEVKRELDEKVEALNDPSERLGTMIRWLQETNEKQFLKVADMLESHTGQIIKSINLSLSKAPQVKWDNFLSHVQKFSADACRNISDVLRKNGITIWYDKEVDRLDDLGIIGGVVNSRLFTLILTNEYFERQYCIFEFCLATVARKPIITLREADERYGGAPLSSFKLPELFQHIRNHDIMEINREYWKPFTDRLTTRLRNTLRSDTKRNTSGPGSENDVKSSILDGSEVTWLTAELRKEERVIGSRIFKSDGKVDFAADFHRSCDGKGATLIVVETSVGSVFGGFTSRAWDGSKPYNSYHVKSSWLFKLRTLRLKAVKRIEINPIWKKFSVRDGILVGGIFGPCFGAGDLTILLKRRTPFYCSKHSYINGLLSEDNKEERFELKEMEVFQVLDFSVHQN